MADPKHKIIQMRERGTDDFHYPVTLTSAIKDHAGNTFEEILAARLEQLGISISDEINNVTSILNTKLSTAESKLAYLATAYLNGLFTIDLSLIPKVSSRSYYYSKVAPATSVGNYWMSSEDRTNIQEYVEDKWVPVSTDLAIFLYAIATKEFKDRGSIKITSSESEPAGSDGDIWYKLQKAPVVYIKMRTRWSLLLPVKEEEKPDTNMDVLIDLVNIRRVPMIYQEAMPTNGAPYWYDGVHLYLHADGFYVQLATSLDNLAKGIFPPSTSEGTARDLYVGSTEPLQSNLHDVWIDSRRSQVYKKTTTGWTLQSNSTQALAYNNLYLDSDSFGRDNVGAKWVDIRSGLALEQFNYPSYEGTAENGNQILKVGGAGFGLGQLVQLRPNTTYTYSIDVKSFDANNKANLYFYVDGAEVANSTLVQGALQEADKFFRHYFTFTTGPLTNYAYCRVESASNNAYLLHSPCLIEGVAYEGWTPSLRDIFVRYSDLLNGITKIVTINRDTPSGDYDDYDIVYNSKTLKYQRALGGVLLPAEEASTALREAMDKVMEVYAEAGVTTVYIASQEPTGSSIAIGDYYIDDHLKMTRYNGSTWSTLSGWIAQTFQEMKGNLFKVTDSYLKSLFFETSIVAGDIADLASMISPNTQIFQQEIMPVESETVQFNVGDLWISSTDVRRWNGVEWSVSGKMKISTMQQDIDGWSSTVATINDTANQANATAQQAMDAAAAARGFIALLSNDSHSIPTDVNGNNGNYTGCATSILVMYGNDDVSALSTYVATPSAGVTGSWNATTRTYTVTGLAGDSGYVDIRADYQDMTIVKRFSLLKLKAGATGVSVQSVQQYYYQSTSATELLGGSWGTEVPTWVSGKFVWTKTKFTFSDGSNVETVPVCTTGSAGQSGQDGVSIQSVVAWYYQSTSPTSLSGGSWSTSIPEWVSGKYVWHKNVITYSNGSTTETTPICLTGANGADGANGRIYALDVSTTVIKKNSKDVFYPANVTISAYYREGTSATRTAYAGRLKISESTNGVDFTQLYLSSSNESSKTYAPSNANVKVILIQLYAAGGTSVLLDTQSVAVVADADDLTVGARNLLSVQDVTNANPARGTLTRDGYEWTLTGNTLADAWAGFGLIADSIFFQNTKYVISFKYKLISGTLSNFGSAGTGFTVNKINLDGNDLTATWSSGAAVTSGVNVVHQMLLYVTRGTSAISAFEIFPNYKAGVTSYSIEIWDVQVEKGTVPTGWTPSPADVEARIDSVGDAVATVASTVAAITTRVDDAEDLISTYFGEGSEENIIAQLTTFEQTVGSIDVYAKETRKTVDGMKEDIDMFFQFKATGLQISSNTENPDYVTLHTNSALEFHKRIVTEQGETFDRQGYVAATGLNMKNIQLQKGGEFAMGNFVWTPMSDGSVSLIFEEGAGDIG